MVTISGAVAGTAGPTITQTVSVPGYDTAQATYVLPAGAAGTPTPAGGAPRHGHAGRGAGGLPHPEPTPAAPPPPLSRRGPRPPTPRRPRPPARPRRRPPRPPRGRRGRRTGSTWGSSRRRCRPPSWPSTATPPRSTGRPSTRPSCAAPAPLARSLLGHRAPSDTAPYGVTGVSNPLADAPLARRDPRSLGAGAAPGGRPGSPSPDPHGGLPGPPRPSLRLRSPRRRPTTSATSPSTTTSPSPSTPSSRCPPTSATATSTRTCAGSWSMGRGTSASSPRRPSPC